MRLLHVRACPRAVTARACVHLTEFDDLADVGALDYLTGFDDFVNLDDFTGVDDFADLDNLADIDNLTT